MAADRGVMEGRAGSGLEEEDDDFCGVRDTASESEVSLEGWTAGTFGTGAPAGIIAAAHVGIIADSVSWVSRHPWRDAAAAPYTFVTVYGARWKCKAGGAAPNSGGVGFTAYSECVSIAGLLRVGCEEEA